MNHKALLFSAFALGIKPEQKLDIVEWSSKYVTLARSSRSETADLNQTPWLIEPLRTILGNDHVEVVVSAPVGSGKSTMFEIVGTYIVAEKPGYTLFATQTNPDAQEWMQTGLMPALKGCSLIDNLWPKQKNLIRKDFVQFPHMVLFCGGSNLSNFQSKSCDTVLIDEVWRMDKGLLEEARRRTHDRFNSKVVLVSQAGVIGDDFDNAYKQTFSHEFCYKCPSCKTFQKYNFDNLKWECEKEEERVIWETLVVRYECPCGHVFNDTANDRRAMAESGRYQATHSDNPLKGHIGYHYTALNVWWITWRKLVIEFLQANDQKKKGDYTPLRQFFQKRLARSWDEFSMLEDSPLSLSDYTFAEATKWDKTIITGDVQQQDIWYTVRTWTKAGESRLLECNKVLTFGQLEEVQKKWEVPSNCVFLDSAYRVEDVKGALVRYGWLGLNGRADAYYDITHPRTQRKYKRIYGMPIRHSTPDGKLAIITYFSSNSAKDILFILKSGNGSRWEVPSDVGEQYKNMLNSEIKVVEGGKVKYKKIKKDNHWLDTEAMQIVGAMMHYCYPLLEIYED